MRLTSIVLWVQENKLSEKFYKKLGFDVVQSSERDSIVALHGFQLHLVNMRDDEPFARDSMAGDKGRGMYLYINVDDVDKLHDTLQEKGMQSLSEPCDWGWGNREFIIKDPDGYKLCFWQRI